MTIHRSQKARCSEKMEHSDVAIQEYIFIKLFVNERPANGLEVFVALTYRRLEICLSRQDFDEVHQDDGVQCGDRCDPRLSSPEIEAITPGS